MVAANPEEPVVITTNFRTNCHNILALGTKENDHLHNFGDKLPSDTVTSGKEKTQGEYYIQYYFQNYLTTACRIVSQPNLEMT